MNSNADRSEDSRDEFRPESFAPHAIAGEDLRRAVEVLRCKSADNLRAIGLLLPVIERTLTAIETHCMQVPKEGFLSAGDRPPAQPDTFACFGRNESG